MRYFQIEKIAGPNHDTAVSTMTAAGYSPVAATTIRLDEQERTGKGVQATKISGLGLSPVAITATPSQVGSTPRFVRKLERDIDIKLSILADSLFARMDIETKLNDILSGEVLLRRSTSTTTTGIELPATYHYLRVYFAGGGTYDMGEGSHTTEKELELVITLRAHKPDWKLGG